MDWQPSASARTLEMRANMLYQIREFFRNKNVLEVETPIMSHAATTDPAIESFSCDSVYKTGPLYLQTSPEFAMKRLLSAGFTHIYQIVKAFRAGEAGRWHNPEFTMLEWYRTGWQFQQLVEECIELIQTVSTEGRSIKAVNRYSYQQLFERQIGLNPHVASQHDLVEIIKNNSVQVSFDLNSASKDLCLELILTHLIEPSFDSDELLVIYDYPASQAALARLRQINDGQQSYSVAERFEIYWGVTELANGFQELTDAKEQQQRFIQENKIRQQNNLPEYPYDQHLIAALQAGMPECTGVALGIDRLFACLTGTDDIRQLISFDFARA